MICALDHIAIGCRDLSEGRAFAEARLGISLSPRGAHARMGTHNHLASLGGATYFEVIAPDPDAQAPDHPRWFDLDNVAGPLRLTNWIVQTDDLAGALARLPAGAGEIIGFERGDYRWRMAVPRDGKLPYDQCFPALIQWDSAHPAPHLVDHGLRLERLTVAHPQAATLAAALAPLGPLANVEIVPSDAPRLSARLTGSTGEIAL